MNRYCCLSLLIVGTAVTAFAENWPAFRGPTRQGHSSETNLPISWSTTKNVTWKKSIAGRGWSSPVHVDGRVILTTAEEKRGNLALSALCLSAADGSVVWSRELFVYDKNRTPSIHGKNSQASPTPVVEGNRIYTHFGHLGIACLDLKGRVVWKNDKITYKPVHGNGGSPALVGDHLVFSCDGATDPFVVALDKNTGRIAWKFDRKSDGRTPFSFSTPLVIEAEGKTQVVTPGSNVVSALDPKSGREIWRVHYKGYSVIPRPVFAHGMVYVATGFDRATLMAIRPTGQGDVTDTHVSWVVTKRAPLTPSPLVVGDELYMVADNGVASCLDAKTGKVHWQERACGPISASPLYAGGKIYLQDELGKGVVLEAGKNFRILAENDLKEKSLASYAVGDGCFFIRTEKHLYRVER